MLAPAELDDLDLFGAAMSLDRGCHLATIKQRRTDLDIIPVSNHQNLVEFNSVTFTGIQCLHPQSVSLDNAILLSTRLYNRIHVKNSKNFRFIVEKGANSNVCIRPGQLNPFWRKVLIPVKLAVKSVRTTPSYFKPHKEPPKHAKNC